MLFLSSISKSFTFLQSVSFHFFVYQYKFFCRVEEHFSHFNDCFNDSCSERRPASVPCSSEAFDAHNGGYCNEAVQETDDGDGDSVSIFYNIFICRYDDKDRDAILSKKVLFYR